MPGTVTGFADGHAHRDAESLRLAEDRARTANSKRWGPYLSERQWGTVREDYSAAAHFLYGSRGGVQGRRPCHGNDHRFAANPRWRDLVLFHEYFHGDDGRGLGASHQTGWTALVTRLFETSMPGMRKYAPAQVKSSSAD